MKIIYIDDIFHPDAGYQANLLSKYWVKFGHEVYIFTSEMGKIPSGYDDRKEYTIWAKKEGSQMRAYRLENIRIEFSS